MPKQQANIILPEYLKKGDKIGLVAPARKISMKEIADAIQQFNAWGLEVVFAPNIFGDCNQFSGTDEERTADLQGMLDHPEIKAIICARGGYGSLRIIDALDFRAFKKQPKWIVGFSDITVLHSHIHTNFNIATLHAMMPLNIVNGAAMEPRKKALQSLKNALFGKSLSYSISSDPMNRTGCATGVLCGGNLSLLYALQGSSSDIDTRDKILFIEDLDEYLYHIDRMMLSLRRSGKFSHIKGLIVGGMTEMRDNKIPFGKTAKEIIAETLAPFDFPVCFNFPAGHIDDNRAFVFGQQLRMEVGKKVIIEPIEKH